METFNRDFKGIWIPAEVWQDKRLNAMDKIVLAEIDSLDTGEGCFASNQYLAEFCQCSVRTLQTSLSKLRKCGYIEQVTFNGRSRALRAQLLHGRHEDFCMADMKISAPLYNNIYNNNKTKDNIDYNNITPHANNARYTEVVDLYNQTCKSLPKVTRLSDARKRAIKTVLNKYTIGDLQIAFEKVEASDFLTGRAKNGWKNASFDWLMKDTNLTKVLDGNYDNKNQSGLRYDWSKV